MTLADWIAVSNAVITFLFTGMVWWATKRSADVAEANYKFTRTLMEQQHIEKVNIENNLRTHYRKMVYNKLVYLANALFQVKSIKTEQTLESIAHTMRELLNAPSDYGVEDVMFAKYFSEEEMTRVATAFTVFKMVKKGLQETDYENRLMYEEHLNSIKHNAETVWNVVYEVIELLKPSVWGNERTIRP